MHGFNRRFHIAGRDNVRRSSRNEGLVTRPRRKRFLILGWLQRRDVWQSIAGLAVVAMLLTVQGCGGGGGGSDPVPAPTPAPTGQDTGQLIIGLTDAEGDFDAYAIDVLSITLQRANGDTVETLPLSTRVDFSELTEVTEFVTVATIPVGNYVSASMRLDYSDAEIVVQDEDGNSVAANPVDENGDPMTDVEVRLSLTTSDEIRVAPGRPAAFSLDFDLDASNEIDLTTNPATVTVQPFLLATPELETDRSHRLRGTLQSVDVAASEFTLRVRPFRHRTGQFGELDVAVTDTTEYEVDGVAYTGADGLDALAGLADSSPVVARGMILADGFSADEVVAGSSVPWSDSDVVRGVVAARVGNTVTVKGARIEFSDGRRVFRGEFTVTLGPDTVITALATDTADLSPEDVSIGSRILAFGELVDDETIDASSGRVRLLMNQLTAEVLATDALADLDVDVFFLNGRRPAAYDFTGTGVTEDQNSNPERYEIDTGALQLSNVDVGDLIRVRGFVNEFGMAPPDYNARTVIDVATDMRAATLRVHWPEGSTRPFTSLAEARVDVDLEDARKLIKIRGVPREFTELLASVALIAPDEGRGVYAVKVRGGGQIHLFRSFEDLVQELNDQLDAGNVLHSITANGRYNVDSAELTTGRAGFVFHVPAGEPE